MQEMLKPVEQPYISVYSFLLTCDHKLNRSEFGLGFLGIIVRFFSDVL